MIFIVYCIWVLPSFRILVIKIGSSSIWEKILQCFLSFLDQFAVGTLFEMPTKKIRYIINLDNMYTLITRTYMPQVLFFYHLSSFVKFFKPFHLNVCSSMSSKHWTDNFVNIASTRKDSSPVNVHAGSSSSPANPILYVSPSKRAPSINS